MWSTTIIISWSVCSSMQTWPLYSENNVSCCIEKYDEIKMAILSSEQNFTETIRADQTAIFFLDEWRRAARTNVLIITFQMFYRYRILTIDETINHWLIRVGITCKYLLIPPNFSSHTSLTPTSAHASLREKSLRVWVTGKWMTPQSSCLPKCIGD